MEVEIEEWNIGIQTEECGQRNYSSEKSIFENNSSVPIRLSHSSV
jgi:hypothetical protein